MKKTLLGMASAALLVMAGPGFASPPHGGGYGHGGGYYGHGGGHYGHGGYWGPGVGIYYGGLGYWGAGLYPYGWGYGYGYPYAYAPLVLEAQTLPQTFIQQEPAAAIVTQEAPATSYWYYCAQPAGYFPYVQKCSQEWIKVVPQIPAGQPTAPRTAP